MKDMLDQILQIEKKYNELGVTLSDPAVIQDYNKFRDLSKQRKSMEETVELYYAWLKATKTIEDDKELLKAKKTKKCVQC
jgi:peptide chain release factor 1